MPYPAHRPISLTLSAQKPSAISFSRQLDAVSRSLPHSASHFAPPQRLPCSASQLIRTVRRERTNTRAAPWARSLAPRHVRRPLRQFLSICLRNLAETLSHPVGPLLLRHRYSAHREQQPHSEIDPRTRRRAVHAA